MEAPIPHPDTTGDETARQAALFHAETLTTSFLAERLRNRRASCDRCGAKGHAVLVSGEQREWLCRYCLGEPRPPLQYPTAWPIQHPPAGGGVPVSGGGLHRSKIVEASND